jgi:hypothetical protein
MDSLAYCPLGFEGLLFFVGGVDGYAMSLKY